MTKSKLFLLRVALIISTLPVLIFSSSCEKRSESSPTIKAATETTPKDSVAAPTIKGHWTAENGQMMDFPSSGSEGTFTYTSKYKTVAAGKWDIRDPAFKNYGTTFIKYNLILPSGERCVFSIDYKKPDVGRRTLQGTAQDVEFRRTSN